jgi:hypothetical protein
MYLSAKTETGPDNEDAKKVSEWLSQRWCPGQSYNVYNE